MSGSREAQQAVIEMLREHVMGFLAVSFDERLGSVELSGHPATLEAYHAFDEGLTLYTNGRYAEATEPLQLAYELDSTFTLPLFYAAAAQYNAGRVARSDSIIDLLDWRRNRLSEYERLRFENFKAFRNADHAASYEAVCRAAEIAPGSRIVYDCAWTALFGMNFPQKALELLGRLDPVRGAMRGWLPYWDRMVDALHRLGEHERELEMARRARELYPNNPRALMLEGIALAALGMVDEALEVADEAASLEGGAAMWGPSIL